MTYHAQQGVDTCIARIFNTYGPRMRRERRPRVGELPQPGARGQAAHRVRRRLADAVALLRRRPDPRALPARDERASTCPVNIGNPDHEVTMLELAQTVIRVTGSTSEIVFEALPDRRPAGAPARHHARPAGARLGAGDRPRGRAAPLAARARPGAGRRLMRGVGVVVAVRRSRRCVAASAQPAHASRYMRVGIYDEAQTLYGTDRPDVRRRSSSCTCRSSASTSTGAARTASRSTRPAHATNPADPAYDWTLYDRTVQLRGAVRDARALLDLRHAGLGERRRRR